MKTFQLIKNFVRIAKTAMIYMQAFASAVDAFVATLQRNGIAVEDEPKTVTANEQD